jgi:SAM-dependent methyltransferase
MINSVSENHGLALMTQKDKMIYSVGISTGGLAEIRMVTGDPERTIIATTIDQAGADFASEQISKRQLDDQITIKIEDVAQPLPYADESFDFIYARLVLHYLPKISLERALMELYRILKPGGKLFVVVRSKDCIEARGFTPDAITEMTTYVSVSGGTYSRFFHDTDSISSFLVQAGFQIIHAKTYEEQLCIDFQRTKLSPEIDSLIEVFVSK